MGNDKESSEPIEEQAAENRSVNQADAVGIGDFWAENSMFAKIMAAAKEKKEQEAKEE